MRAQILNCQSCQQPFKKRVSEIKKTKNHFCSRQCAGRFNMTGKQHNPPKPKICRACQTNYLTSKTHSAKTLCESCKNDFYLSFDNGKDITLEQLYQRPSVKGKHPSWAHAQVRTTNRAWNKSLSTKPCAKCQYDKHVELCHIKAISSFPKTATLGEINSSTNVIQLCRNCHWEFDHGLLTL